MVSEKAKYLIYIILSKSPYLGAFLMGVGLLFRLSISFWAPCVKKIVVVMVLKRKSLCIREIHRDLLLAER